MPEVARPARRGTASRGSPARFARWYAASTLRQIESLLPLLDGPPAREEIDADIARSLRRGKRAQTVRLVVTILLAMGAIATAAAALASLLPVPDAFEANVTLWVDTVRLVARVTGAATVVLLLARLAIDRYLARVETAVTFLAMARSRAS